MSKLDFGGFDPRFPHGHELDADPLPLLDQIAECALKGEALPPALAKWFYEVHKARRVKVVKRRGAKRKDDLSQLFKGLSRIEELTSVAFEPQNDADAALKTPMSQTAAIKLVKQEFGLRSSAAVFKHWIAVEKNVQREMDEDRRLQARSDFVKLFKQLKAQGLSGEPALLHVLDYCRQDLPYKPFVDELREWQDYGDADLEI